MNFGQAIEATGAFQPGWLVSQADMLAEDWEVFCA